MSVTAIASPQPVEDEMKEGDRIYFRRNYKTEMGVYALTGDAGVISGTIMYDTGELMAYIVDLDRPRVKGFETLYVSQELITPAPKKPDTKTA